MVRTVCSHFLCIIFCGNKNPPSAEPSRIELWEASWTGVVAGKNQLWAICRGLRPFIVPKNSSRYTISDLLYIIFKETCGGPDPVRSRPHYLRVAFEIFVATPHRIGTDIDLAQKSGIHENLCSFYIRIASFRGAYQVEG